jgi:hypothetical protein
MFYDGDLKINLKLLVLNKLFSCTNFIRKIPVECLFIQTLTMLTSRTLSNEFSMNSFIATPSRLENICKNNIPLRMSQRADIGD